MAAALLQTACTDSSFREERLQYKYCMFLWGVRGTGRERQRKSGRRPHIWALWRKVGARPAPYHTLRSCPLLEGVRTRAVSLLARGERDAVATTPGR